MALHTYKITDAAIADKGVVAAPDRLEGKPQDNKRVFDRLIRETVKDMFNGLIDALTGENGASEIGANVDGVTGNTVAATLEAIKLMLEGKAEQTATAALIKEVEFDATSGKFKFTRQDGTFFEFDTALEKVATNWRYDAESQSLVLTLEDGSEQRVSLSDFVTLTEFESSGSIVFSQSGDKVTASIKQGGVTEAMLETTLLQKLRDYVVSAGESQKEAASSATAAAESARTAAESKVAAASSATNTKQLYDAVAILYGQTNADKDAAEIARQGAERAQELAEQAQEQAALDAALAKSSRQEANAAADRAEAARDEIVNGGYGGGSGDSAVVWRAETIILTYDLVRPLSDLRGADTPDDGEVKAGHLIIDGAGSVFEVADVFSDHPYYDAPAYKVGEKIGTIKDDSQAVADAIAAAQGTADEAGVAAASARSLAEAAQSTAGEAKKAADDAQEKAEEALLFAEHVRRTADDAQEAADTAQSTADAANAAAGNAQEAASLAKATADGAKETADDAKNKAIAAQATADAAQSAAGNAQAAADTAKETADAAKEIADENAKDISTMQGFMPDLMATVENTVDNVNTLDQTVTAHVTAKNNPHSVTAAQVGAPTVQQMNDAIAAASLGGGGGGGATSWDDLGKGYGIGELLKETTLTATNTLLSEALPLTAGYEYTVTWNGTEYVRTAKDISAFTGVDGSAYVGNFSGNTGEPFFISYKPGEGTTINIVSGSAPATVSVSGYGLVTTPIPTKYLPDHLQFGEENGMVEVLAEYHKTFAGADFYIETPFELAIGEKYIVNWNGVEYKATAIDSAELGNNPGHPILINDGANVSTGVGAVFAILGLGAYAGEDGTYGQVQVLDGSTDVTLSIYRGGTIIHPIDGKYLPEGLPYIDGTVYMEETEAIPYTHAQFGKTWFVGAKADLAVGESYQVIYNGGSYNCTCITAPTGMSTDKNAVALGNLAAVGGTNTGEPFAMLISPTLSRIDITDLSGATAVKIGIFSVGMTRERIDAACVPEGTPTIFNIALWVDPSGLELPFANKSFEEIQKHASNINEVVRLVILNNGNQGQVAYLPLTACGAEGALFTMVNIEYGVPVMLIVAISADNIVEIRDAKLKVET